MLPIYIGTYTDGASKGIYRLELDRDRARLSRPVLVAEALNPSYLAWHPSRRLLYSTSETNTVGPRRTGAVLAYGVGENGSLELINQVSSGGAGACFVSVHPEGSHVFVANYGAGSVAVFPIRMEGGIAEASALVQHVGSGAHAERQKGPHAHAIGAAPKGPFVLAADLGADRIFVYRFDAEHGMLRPHDPPAMVAPAGAGPRHFAAHPSGEAVFLIQELTSTIVPCAWDSTSGTLDDRGVVSMLPEGFTRENTAAEVAVHSSGRFVFGSNRGADSIAVFRVETDWTLTRVDMYGTEGKTPRHFALDPSGAFMLVANQESDSLVLFRIDEGTGALVDTGARAFVPTPVFVGMFPTQ